MPQVTLPGGRVLAYREYGDPRGMPVICNHGGLLCGQDVSPAHAAALSLGVRLVSPDRPGVGSSTPEPGRRTADWAVDAEALADHLHLERFGAYGWSMGGQYALALGALLPRRTFAVVVVAGCLPQPAPAQLNPTDRRFLRLSSASPAAAAVAFGAIRTMARVTPGLVVSMTARTLCPADRDVLGHLPAGAFAEWMAAAMSVASGMVEEYRALGRSWGFALRDVQAPTTYWQGGRDTLVSPLWARDLARSTPSAQLREVPGDGHFLAYRRWHEVLAPFAAV
ncbi:MAG: alpha/beta hydrolase [Micrococcales bacterium]|nr:alpha/beta hydrolase [Micrococcales bacterium]